MLNPNNKRYCFVEVYEDLLGYFHVRKITGNLDKKTKTETFELDVSEFDAVRKINDIEIKLRRLGYQYVVTNDANEFTLIPQFINEI